MKPTKVKRVRRNRDKENCKALVDQLSRAHADRGKEKTEADRLNAAALLATAILKAERAELVARIMKIDVLCKAAGARHTSETSPPFTYLERY